MAVPCGAVWCVQRGRAVQCGLVVRHGRAVFGVVQSSGPWQRGRAKALLVRTLRRREQGVWLRWIGIQPPATPSLLPIIELTMLAQQRR